MMESSSRKRVILMIESSRAFGQLLVKGIVNYSKCHSHWSLYREASGLDEHRPETIKWAADGIIAHVLDVKTAYNIIPSGMPAIVKGINELIPNVCNIVGDTKAIGEMAADYLMKLGFKSFAFCGYEEVLWSREFAHYFCQKLEENGFSASLYSQDKYRLRRSYQKELEKIAKWLHSLPKPLGVMASNDDRGQHVIEASKIAGYRIPNDVGIIGVDNDEWICCLTEPPMSSIALNTERAGYETAEMLDKLMSGQHINKHTIIIRPMTIVSRQSTDMLYIDDPEVLSALEYIKNNYEKPIQADDVVNATTISRRALYYRFKRIIGRTINDELRRVRIEHIAKLLVETNLSISRITEDCKYTSIRNVARYFKKEKGMNLIQYRQKFGKNM